MFIVAALHVIMQVLCFFDLSLNRKQYVVYDHGNVGDSWRKQFVLAGLQKLRKSEWSSYYAVLVLTILTLFCFDLQLTSGYVVGSGTTDRSIEVEEYVPAICFVAFCWFVCVGIVKDIIRCFRGNEVEKLTDALPVLNCSLLVLDSRRSGYFVYGKSQFGDTDQTCQYLAMALRREALGQFPKRGLQYGKSCIQFRLFFGDDCKELVNVSNELAEVQKFVSDVTL